MSQSRVSVAWAAASAILSAVGIGLATYLVNVKLRLEFDPTFQSSCNFGSKLNCDLVQTSDQSLVLGYPLALWGAATYVAVLLLTVFAAKSSKQVDRGDDRGWRRYRLPPHNVSGVRI